MFGTMLKSVPATSLRMRNASASLRRVSSVCQAKKGKGAKGGKGAKKGSLITPFKLQPWQSTDLIMQHLLMVESYRYVFDCSKYTAAPQSGSVHDF
jgi:hypothetical protein